MQRRFTAGSRKPWLTGKGAGGSYKNTPDEFSVRELPSHPPEGEGEHQWLKIEKIGYATGEIASMLAELAGVPRVNVGYAGLKDREARTVQCFTVQGGRPVEAMERPGIRILERSFCRKKLRVGDLAGNRFDIRVRGCDVAVLQARATRLTRIPNYYGIQRFAGGAAERGYRLLTGERLNLPEPEIKFALSAWQSARFNEVLDLRKDQLLAGDIVEDGIPTGPIFGHQMQWPVDEALELEEEVLERSQVSKEALGWFPMLTKGTRRKCWVDLRVRVEPVAEGAWLRFALPGGSYATIVLEELLGMG